MDDNVVRRLAEIGAAWTPPPPLDTVPESWRNWPTPVPHTPPVGSVIALHPAMITASGVDRPDAILAADPTRLALFTTHGSWIRIDLGRNVPVLGVRIWNIHHAMNDLFESGLIRFSPDVTGDGATSTAVTIDEAPGFPTYYPGAGPCRYIAIRSLNSAAVELGRIEVIAFA